MTVRRHEFIQDVIERQVILRAVTGSGRTLIAEIQRYNCAIADFFDVYRCRLVTPIAHHNDITVPKLLRASFSTINPDNVARYRISDQYPSPALILGCNGTQFKPLTKREGILTHPWHSRTTYLPPVKSSRKRHNACSMTTGNKVVLVARIELQAEPQV